MCQYFSRDTRFWLSLVLIDIPSLLTLHSKYIHIWKERKKQGGREGGDEGRKEGRKGETKRGKERKRDRLSVLLWPRKFSFCHFRTPALSMPSSPLPFLLSIFLYTFFQPKHRLVHKWGKGGLFIDLKLCCEYISVKLINVLKIP